MWGSQFPPPHPDGDDPSGRHTQFTPLDAEASCDAVLGALAADRVPFESTSRFGLALFERTEKADASPTAAGYRATSHGEPSNPVEAARVRAYAAVRAMVEQEGGVSPYEICADLAAGDGTAQDAGQGVGEAPRRFHATLRTLKGKHEMVFANEGTEIRLVEVR